ncbi:MAG: hypothetical protein O8C64_14730 [Candidatus Methanoperedens sp.]|nr:hypothetical protein [Candidatus Methanoperedens sp.]
MWFKPRERRIVKAMCRIKKMRNLLKLTIGRLGRRKERNPNPTLGKRP